MKAEVFVLLPKGKLLPIQLECFDWSLMCFTPYFQSKWWNWQKTAWDCSNARVCDDVTNSAGPPCNSRKKSQHVSAWAVWNFTWRTREGLHSVNPVQSEKCSTREYVEVDFPVTFMWMTDMSICMGIDVPDFTSKLEKSSYKFTVT